MANPCSKKVTPETAYEVWEDASGTWRWYCLKKYQSPEHEALNPYSRWYCAVQSPMTNGRFEYGDVYAANVKAAPNHLIANPLVSTCEQVEAKKCDVCLTWVATHEVTVGDETFSVCDKPRCQDKVAALIPLGTDNQTPGGENEYPLK